MTSAKQYLKYLFRVLVTIQGQMRNHLLVAKLISMRDLNDAIQHQHSAMPLALKHEYVLEQGVFGVQDAPHAEGEGWVRGAVPWAGQRVFDSVKMLLWMLGCVSMSVRCGKERGSVIGCSANCQVGKVTSSEKRLCYKDGRWRSRIVHCAALECRWAASL